MAEITLRYWAGAARAAGCDEEAASASTIGQLRADLGARPELAKISIVASFLVDGQVSGEATKLYDGAVVDVLPPFAGG